ncbi:MAG: leucyl aminopeptidase [Frankiales bacterium]|nr:leucyl aminopeptidase [Frankiales bacterium]
MTKPGTLLSGLTEGSPLPQLALVSGTGSLGADLLVVGTVAGSGGLALAPGAGLADTALGGRLLAALRAVDAGGRTDELVKIPTLGLLDVPVVVAVGLGKVADGDGLPALDLESVRRAVGSVVRTISSARRVTIAIGDGTDPALVSAIAEGALLGSYRFQHYKSGATPSKLRRVQIVVADPADRAARATLRRARTIAEAVNATRDLVNIPASVLNPVTFADYARRRAEAAGLSVEVLDERKLARGGFGGVLAVGAGSATPPRMVRITYSPPRPRARVALVGKGITFDTGGLNLKVAMMAQMKSDMGGAAAVISSVIAAAQLRLPVEVTATVPMAENAVSGSSYRPSDVLTLRDGRTVEVDDTDAEGRLILADALLRACEDVPDFLIETSTLTGGQLVALGPSTSGVMGSEDFRDRVAGLAAVAGESVWAMPLPPALRAGLDSPVADITNLPKERWGSMLVAGLFLAEFVAEGVEWVHLDIAGPSFANSASGYNARGGTGAIVRTILATLTDLAGG